MSRQHPKRPAGVVGEIWMDSLMRERSALEQMDREFEGLQARIASDSRSYDCTPNDSDDLRNRLNTLSRQRELSEHVANHLLTRIRHGSVEGDDAESASLLVPQERSSEVGRDGFEPSASRKVVRPPGSHWRYVGELLVSPRKYELEIEPAIADWHEEYFDALDQERGHLKMTAIRIRHTWGLLKAFGLVGWLHAIGKVVKTIMPSSN